MPKGYVIARAEVTDMEAWKNYVAKSAVAIKKFGGKPIVRGGQFETLEGEARPRNVVIEFESYQTALNYAKSDEYLEARALRKGAGIIDFIVIEGV